MTANDILNKLKNEPDFLASIIVFNNPEAVAYKFKDIIAIQNDNPQLLETELLNFLKTGDIQSFEYCLKVPFLTENIQPALAEAVEKLKQQYYGDTQTRVDMYSSGLYELITQANTPKDMAQTATINTPAGSFQASISENVKNNKKVYYVLAAAIIIGAIIYYYKK